MGCTVPRVITIWRTQALQGYLARKKTPTPPGTPQDPIHRPTIGSYRVAFSYERGTPVTRVSGAGRMAPGAKGSPGTRRGVGLESPVAGRVQPTPETRKLLQLLYKRSCFTLQSCWHQGSWFAWARAHNLVGVGMESPVAGRVHPKPEILCSCFTSAVT